MQTQSHDLAHLQRIINATVISIMKQGVVVSTLSDAGHLFLLPHLSINEKQWRCRVLQFDAKIGGTAWGKILDWLLANSPFKKSSALLTNQMARIFNITARH